MGEIKNTTPDPSTPGEVERLVDALIYAMNDYWRASIAHGDVAERMSAGKKIQSARTALLSHITAARPEGAGDLARQAYDLDFAASGEGWNGEYPHDAAETESYARSRAEDLARLLNKPAATNPQDQE